MSTAKTLVSLALTLSLIAVSSSTTTFNHLHRREKLSHLRVFLHEIAAGKNPSMIKVFNPPANNSSPNKVFGAANIFDDPLTVGPDPNSEFIGRAQGTYAVASQEGLALLMAMNFHFRQGKYNGSTITIHGRNPVSDEKVRELPVIGGTGLFRFARGYALTTTHFADVSIGSFIVEYNLYVLHY